MDSRGNVLNLDVGRLQKLSRKVTKLLERRKGVNAAVSAKHAGGQ